MSFAQGLMAAGTVVSAYGQIAAGKGAQAASNYNASIAERNAKAADNKAVQLGRVAGWEALEDEKKFVELNDRAQMGYGSNGWLAATGTPLKRTMRNVIRFQQDMETQKYNTKVKQNEQREVATNMRLNASLKRLEGRIMRKTARMQAFGTLLSGAGKIMMV